MRGTLSFAIFDYIPEYTLGLILGIFESSVSADIGVRRFKQSVYCLCGIFRKETGGKIGNLKIYTVNEFINL